MGPNIYCFYYTPKNLCATFCTAYDVKGKAALSSQSGGIGMAIIGFSRSAGMGVSAIVGLGNKSDIDEDDLLTFFEQDDNTEVIAQHLEDLKDGRAFAEVARRVCKKKPVIVLRAGRTSAGAKAASSHTGALAGNDKIYEDVFNQSGVLRARSLRDLLDFARGVPVLPTPKGENVVIITGAGGSGVLHGSSLVEMGLGTAIGAITFTGSIIAIAKLQGLITGRPLVFFGQHPLNALLGVLLVLIGAWFATGNRLWSSG
jgi:acyl-CoA synthetase (NDP forming)